MPLPTTYNIQKSLSLNPRLVISEQDLGSLADKILKELDVDPSELSEDKIKATAEKIGSEIFEKIFGSNSDILEQHRLNAPKYIEAHEEFRTYRSNWDRLMEALKAKQPKFIHHSGDWNRIARILRRCYRPEAVKKMAKNINSKASLEWEVLTELQRPRYHIEVVEESLKKVLNDNLKANKTRKVVRAEEERVQRERRFEIAQNRNDRSKGVLGTLAQRAKRGKAIIQDVEDLDEKQMAALIEDLEALDEGMQETYRQIQQIKEFIGMNGNGDETQEAELSEKEMMELEALIQQNMKMHKVSRTEAFSMILNPLEQVVKMAQENREREEISGQAQSHES